jgi:hypothetical protein
MRWARRLLLIAATALLAATAAAEEGGKFVTLWRGLEQGIEVPTSADIWRFGGGISQTVRRVAGVPFVVQSWMLMVQCPGTEGSTGPLSAQIGVPKPYVSAYSWLHLLVSAGHATSVPDGVLVGWVMVHHTDGTCSTLELVMGKNIAEWAYARPDNQECLGHRKIPGVPHGALDTVGYRFYSRLELARKPIVSIELRIEALACYERAACPAHPDAGTTSWLRIHLEALTLER